jgi:hypothetical protein
MGRGDQGRGHQAEVIKRQAASVTGAMIPEDGGWTAH